MATLGCDSVWAWNCNRSQLENFLSLGLKVFVVAGSHQSVFTDVVDAFKDLEVTFVVDDWIGGGDPLRQIRNLAPQRPIGVCTYSVDLLRQVPSELYDCVFSMNYPVLKTSFDYCLWLKLTADMKAFTNKPCYTWIQAYADNERRIPSENQMKTLLYTAQSYDGAFFFLPKNIAGLDSVSDDLISHPELFPHIQQYPNLPKPADLPTCAVDRTSLRNIIAIIGFMLAFTGSIFYMSRRKI